MQKIRDLLQIRTLNHWTFAPLHGQLQREQFHCPQSPLLFPVIIFRNRMIPCKKATFPPGITPRIDLVHFESNLELAKSKDCAFQNKPSLLKFSTAAAIRLPPARQLVLSSMVTTVFLLQHLLLLFSYD